MSIPTNRARNRMPRKRKVLYFKHATVSTRGNCGGARELLPPRTSSCPHPPVVVLLLHLSPYCPLVFFLALALVTKVLMSYPAFVLIPLVLTLGTVLYFLYGLLVNYNAARKTGLPLIVLPFDCGNPLWLIIDRKIVQLVRRIPFCSGTFTRFNWRGWEIWDRYRAHQQLGDAIFFVTPGKNYLQICDAEAVSEIFQRRADFCRPPETTGKVLAHTKLRIFITDY